MKKALFIFILLTSCILSAQTQDAWVYFTNKENVEAALANPITILTQAAIDRKTLHNTPIDARDVPVNEAYIAQIKSEPGITYFAKSKWFNCVYVRGTQNDINALKNLSFVDHIDFSDASLNSRSTATGKTKHFQAKDNKFGVQTDFVYGDAANQVEMLHVNYLHEQGYTGEGITMAVLDAGFYGVNTIDAFQRMRSNGDLLNGYDFVGRTDNEFLSTASTHGSMVVSTISGYIENQFVGTAPDASVYLFRTEDVASETPVEMAYWVEAAERADSLGVWVINTSLGYNTFDNPAYNFTQSDMDGETAFMSRGATIAFEKGMLIVNSAGNSGNNAWGIITSPADSPGAFTVGAVDATGAYANFSSTGPTADGRVKPDVVAQGQQAAVITPSGTIVNANGTSFSSPIMAGAIASLWEANPEKTNAEIMQIVRQSASQFNNPDKYLGYGIPNFEIALASLSTEENTLQNAISVYPNPVKSTLFINFSQNNGSATIQIFSILGKKVYESTIKKISAHLNISYLSSGLYMVKIISEENSSVFKIVKQ